MRARPIGGGAYQTTACSVRPGMAASSGRGPLPVLDSRGRSGRQHHGGAVRAEAQHRRDPVLAGHLVAGRLLTQLPGQLAHLQDALGVASPNDRNPPEG